MTSEWSRRQKKEPSFFCIVGTSYVNVKAGTSHTNTVTTKKKDRERYYRDPAIVITEENLDQWQGAEGVPLCLEHDKQNVIGKVFRTWVSHDDEHGKCLQIAAKVPLPAGQQIMEDVKAGKYTGFSVSYKNAIDKRSKRVEGKMFQEISLVEDPFFRGCSLDYAVEASAKEKKEISKPSYKTSSDIYCSIDLNSCSVMETEKKESAPEPTSEARPNTPAAEPSVKPSELVRQTALLHEELEESRRLVEQQKQELERHRQAEAKRRATYEAEQLPKLEAYLNELVASNVLSPDKLEAARAEYKPAFCTEELAPIANQWIETAKVMASNRLKNKELADRLNAVEQEKEAWRQAGEQSSSVNASARAKIAKTLEPKEPKETSDVDASSRPTLRSIMMPKPTEQEKAFLAENGFHHYSDNSEVNASAGLSPAPKTFGDVNATRHANMELFTDSARFGSEGSRMLWAFLSGRKMPDQGFLNTVAPLLTDPRYTFKGERSVLDTK